MGDYRLKVTRAEPRSDACGGCGDVHDNINATFTLEMAGQLIARLCWDCRLNLEHQLDECNEYTPRGEGKPGGWTRIGRYDRPRRRALWSRMVELEGPPKDGWEDPGIEAIELCAGREGDDAFARITPDNPVFEDVADCIGRAEAAVQGELYLVGHVYTFAATAEPSSVSREGK